MVKNLPAVQETWVRPLGWASGEGHDNPLQYSCQENPMDRGVWQATPWVTKSWIQLSNWAQKHTTVTVGLLIVVSYLVLGTPVQFSSVQLLSRVWLFATPWIAAHQASLSITNSRSSLRLTSIESVMPSSHLILGRPLLLLPSIPPSITVFFNESTLHIRGPKYWSFSFSFIPSKEIPGLISFRMDGYIWKVNFSPYVHDQKVPWTNLKMMYPPNINYVYQIFILKLRL